MAKLSEIHNAIGNYLYIHGDKEVTSIATWCSSAPYEYTFNLCDIHEGHIGTDPCIGKDHLDISK